MATVAMYCHQIKKNGVNYDSAIQKNYMYIKMIAMQPKIDWNNDHLYFSLKIQSK